MAGQRGVTNSNRTRAVLLERTPSKEVFVAAAFCFSCDGLWSCYYSQSRKARRPCRWSGFRERWAFLKTIIGTCSWLYPGWWHCGVSWRWACVMVFTTNSSKSCPCPLALSRLELLTLNFPKLGIGALLNSGLSQSFQKIFSLPGLCWIVGDMREHCMWQLPSRCFSSREKTGGYTGNQYNCHFRR